VAPGDVVVTGKKANQLSKPAAVQKDGKTQANTAAPKPGELRGTDSALSETRGSADKARRKVRQVGPKFLPSN
jgi:hypothetical protein